MKKHCHRDKVEIRTNTMVIEYKVEYKESRKDLEASKKVGLNGRQLLRIHLSISGMESWKEGKKGEPVNARERKSREEA